MCGFIKIPWEGQNAHSKAAEKDIKASVENRGRSTTDDDDNVIHSGESSEEIDTDNFIDMEGSSHFMDESKAPVTNRVVQYLKGLRVFFLHGGMPQVKRVQTYSSFLKVNLRKK